MLPAGARTQRGRPSATVSETLIRAAAIAGLLALAPAATAASFVAPDSAWGLEAAPDVREIHLSWEPPNSTVDKTLAGYRVYRGTSPDDLEPVDTVDQTRYDDAGLDNATTYFYRVNATYADASEGDGTGVANATTYGFPEPPQNATANPGPTPGNVTVTWDPPADDGGSPVESYHVTAYDEAGDRAKEWSLDAADRTVTDAELANGTFRSYRIAAVTDVGEGPVSAPANATTWRPPAAPTNVSARAGPGPSQVNVTFDPPTWDGGTNVTGYIIYRATGDANLTKRGAVAANASSFVDDGVPPGTTLRYAVAARNAVDVGNRSDVVEATSHRRPPAPDVTAGPGPGMGNVTVSWSAVDGGTYPVTTYVVYHRTPDGTWSLLARLDAGNTSHRHGGLADGTTHIYAVAAINDVGQSPRSDVAEATTVALAAAPGNVTARTGSQPGAIDVGWSPPADVGTGNLTGYRVEVRRNASTWTVEGEVGPQTTDHTLGDLAPGVERTVRVRAVTDVGPGAASKPASATSPGRPSAPTDVEADRSANGSRVAVGWQAASTTFEITDYQVQRRADGGDWTRVATVPANRTSWVDDDLPDADRLDYAVVAVDPVGESPRSEPDSIVVPDTSPIVDGAADTTDEPADDNGSLSASTPRSAGASGRNLPAQGGLLGAVILGLVAVAAGGYLVLQRGPSPTPSRSRRAAGQRAGGAAAAAATSPTAALPAPDDVDVPDEVPPGRLRTELESIDVPRAHAPYDAVADALRRRRDALLDALTRGEPVRGVDVATLRGAARRFADAVGDDRTAGRRVDAVADRVADADVELASATAAAIRRADRRRRPDAVADVDEAVDAADRYTAWTHRVAAVDERLIEAARDLEGDVADHADAMLAHWQATVARLLAAGPPAAIDAVLPVRIQARQAAIDRLADLDDADVPIAAADALQDYADDLADAVGSEDRSVEAEVAGLARLVDALQDAPDQAQAVADAVDELDRPGLLGAALARAATGGLDVDDVTRRGPRVLQVDVPRLLGLPDRHVGDAAVLDRVAQIAARGEDAPADALRTYAAGKTDVDPLLDAVLTVLADATPGTARVVEFDAAVAEAVRCDLDRFAVAEIATLRDRIVGPHAGDALDDALARIDDVVVDDDAGLVGRRTGEGLDADEIHRLRRRLDVDPDTLDTFLAKIHLDGGPDHDA